MLYVMSGAFLDIELTKMQGKALYSLIRWLLGCLSFLNEEETQGTMTW